MMRVGDQFVFALGDAVRPGETDIIGDFDYVRWVVGPPNLSAPLGEYPRYMPRILDDLLTKKPHARGELDPTPPPQYSDRLGQYFVPNCASFKVEWALDPDSEFVGGRLDGEKRVYWFDQGDKADPSVSGDVDNPLRALEEILDDDWVPTNIDRAIRLGGPHRRTRTACSSGSRSRRYGLTAPTGRTILPCSRPTASRLRGI